MSKPDNQGEEWEPVPEFEECYEVSTEGRVWSHHSGQELQPYLNSEERGRRYLRVDLRKNGARRQVYVHHLVLEAHEGPRPAGHHAHHIDGNQLNNGFSNLEWKKEEEHIEEHNGEAGQEDEDGPFARRNEEAPF